MRIDVYESSMAADVAEMIRAAFEEHRDLPPITLMSPPAPFATAAELAGQLESDAICRDASVVAVDGGRVVSAAIARLEDGEPCWWRIATARERRREGLARRCVEVGESALRASGEEVMRTTGVVDSRWEAAGALLRACGYELEDPERRNITMRAEGLREERTPVAEGYELTTFTGDDLPGLMACREAVFGGDHGPEWFRDRFMSRSDFDGAGWHLAKHEGQVVGMAGALGIEHERAPRRLRGGQIEYVGVLEEHRRRGLARALMTACVSYLTARGFDSATLITQPFRVPAIRLYESLGFRTIAAWHRYHTTVA